MLQSWRLRVRALKQESYALYLAARDLRTPWYTRLIAGVVVAYAFSPLDLIPDFIPILGMLDDLLLVPLGIALAIRLTPAIVLAESRQRAKDAFESGKPVSRVAAIVIVCVWISLAAVGIATIAKLVS